MTLNDMSIRAILFDFDGTLSDLYPRWIKPVGETIIEIEPSLNPEILRERFTNAMPRLVKASSGYSMFLNIRAAWIIGREAGLSRIQTIRLLLRLRKKKEQFYTITPFEETHQVLQALHHMGYRLALVSTASKKTLEKATNVIPELCLFDVIISRDDVTRTKPDPEPMLKALEALEVDTGQAIFVGDMPQDVEGARNVGCRSVLTLKQWGDLILTLFTDNKPDLIIDDLSFLTDLAITGFTIFQHASIASTTGREESFAKVVE